MKYEKLPPDVKEVLKKYGEIPSVKEAFKIYEERMPHGYLEKKAENKLKRMGYKIISREEAPEWIKRVGSPDIIAVKNGEYILAEVKPSDQLRRYSEAGVKLILVTNVQKGKAVEVWGLEELET